MNKFFLALSLFRKKISHHLVLLNFQRFMDIEIIVRKIRSI